MIKYLSPFDSEWPKVARITVLITSLMLLSALDRILVKIQVTVGQDKTDYRLVFTGDGVGVVFRSVGLYDLVKTAF